MADLDPSCVPKWVRDVGDTVSACKYCGARIRWGVTVKNGKAHPLDAEVGVGAASYLSHFATCPHAERARKR